MGYYEQINSSTPKIKKEHRCAACNVRYPIGTVMHYTVGKFEGDFQASYWCKPCNQYLMAHWDDFEDGVSPGDIWQDDEYTSFRDGYNEKHNLVDPKKQSI